MSHDHIWHWNPLSSVNGINFGGSIQEVVKEYDLILIEEATESDPWDTYSFPDSETQIYAENGKIASIGCFENIYYKDKNLFGISLDEARRLLGAETEIGEPIYNYYDEEPYEKIPIEFEPLGLQLWFRGGIAVDAMVSDPTNDI